MKRKISLLFFVFLLVFTSLYAADGPAYLDSLIDAALKNNPQVKSSFARYEALKAKIPQSASLADPFFEFKYDKMTASMDAVMEGKTGPMRVFGFSQEIPFPTKLLLNAQIASKEAQMAYQDYKEKERDIISQVKAVYARLALTHKNIEIVKENKALLEQMAKTAATQFSLGKASQQDALKAQLEIAKMDNELIMLENTKGVLEAKLNVLRNEEISAPIGIPAVPVENLYDFDLENLYALTKKDRAELQAYRLALERARKIYSLAKAGYLPDFMVKYERMERDGKLTDWAGMIGVTVPIWFWQKQNFNVKEMAKELSSMESELRNKQNMIFFEVKESFLNVEAFKKLAVLFKTTYLPQAEQTLKSSLIGYESNQIDFINLLDSQRMLLEFKLDYYKALVDLEVAAAELERAVGGALNTETKNEEK